MRTVVQETVRTFGKIDILVNNAGILPETIRVPLAEISEKDWDNVLTTNLKGMFLFTKNVLPVMKAQNRRIYPHRLLHHGPMGIYEPLCTLTLLQSSGSAV